MIFFYQLILQIVWILKPLFRFFPHEKIKYFFRHEGRIKSGPIPIPPLWIHASSGEIEYARSLIREIQRQSPEIPLLVTHTSSSSRNTLSKLGVHAWGVAPLDTPQDVKRFLKKWTPRACLIARTDLWPQTLKELHRAGIPTYLFSATFAKGSRKLSLLSRLLLKNTLPLITKIYFVSADDKQICRSFFPGINGEIMGDTRYDQVFFRLQESHDIQIPQNEKILIAGSTWDEDEAVVVPAFEKLKKNHWKFILVPHEINASHLVKLRDHLNKTTLRSHFLSQGLQSFSWNDFDLLLVDQVGILASLYARAQCAFVGGSFKRQVHSVMEALATSAPVILGPFYENNREAMEFKDLGFVTIVKNTDEFVLAIKQMENKLSAIRPHLGIEVKKRLGATQKIMQDLESQGLFY